ncbi:hypothetical protein C1645_823063 [Glomus cerebriforme]|uniref:Histidine phosphatase superfamily n=1 Tax=Glomus cerebriforme TaxID=658196 RepID=A0A397T1D2_9GLOM|nr:hypothetical protein C1645_823063 [Glomus cerebriforme]
MESIFFTRHGHRSDWIFPLPNDCYPTGLTYDPQLSPHGCDQAMQLAQYFDRLDKTMQEIISRCDAEGQIKSILLVAHAASLTAGVRTVLKDKLAVVNCGTCSLTKFIREDRKWILKLNGDCSFLSGGLEDNWAYEL